MGTGHQLNFSNSVLDNVSTVFVQETICFFLKRKLVFKVKMSMILFILFKEIQHSWKKKCHISVIIQLEFGMKEMLCNFYKKTNLGSLLPLNVMNLFQIFC